MSRSAFAARSSGLVGEPAMNYVARWRMHVALTWLKKEDAPVSQRQLVLATSRRQGSAGPSSDFSGSLRGPFDGRSQVQTAQVPYGHG